MRRFPSVAVLVACALGLAACVATSLKSEWSAPDAKPLDLAGKKVLAVVIVANDSIRRSAEDALAREITNRGAQGVAAYTVLTSDQPKDQETVKARLAAEGFAGAAVLRLVRVDKEISSDASSAGAWGTPYYGSFYGYYGRGWGGAYAVPTVRTDTIASIEITCFSIEQDKLVWAGMSETFNPSDVEATIREIAAQVAYSMKKAGLIGGPK